MSFGKDFIWGVATSAYQIEGAAYEADKGECIWDVSSKSKKYIFEGHTGDTACDHYHRYAEDLALLAKLRIRHYRFSVNWARLFPEGIGKISVKGKDFYDRLIDEMLKNGITPYLTLYHWELPYALYKKGGFLNRDMAEWFGEYADKVTRFYGDRVKNYFTFNEPECIIGCGLMEGNHSPYLKLCTKDVLTAAHNLLLANGNACDLIRNNVSGARLGMTHACALPLPSCKEDEADAEKLAFSYNGTMFNNAWFVDPVVFGKYPEEIYRAFGEEIEIRAGDMEKICRKQDFIGLNIYHGRPTDRDINGRLKKVFPHPEVGRSATNWNLTPESLYYGSKYFYDRYRVPIVITENGVALSEWKDEDGEILDYSRIDYIRRYLKELERAIDDGIDVRGYFYWSFMDNFEWTEGYSKRFGLVYVDYKTMERTPKKSAEYYSAVVAGNGTILHHGGKPV
ncbi:MAG: GH1 family beta-glucosidase [Candidatus Borkfalkiaceae bacterium]|nr:GH1 family beta-glucosidase [Clostridia bacterium]MDY6223864.1 GH1 family beta-glucosidase [Christensenellaceae bacterium]